MKRNFHPSQAAEFGGAANLPIDAPPSDAVRGVAACDAEAGSGATCGATAAALAYVLAYPGEFLSERIDEALQQARCEAPQAAEYLQAFQAAVAPLTVEEREELYTRTFDINPVCSMEIGWQLFGEDYHRGALLVRLRGELRLRGIEESTELPDHLTHVLALLDRMSDSEAQAFAECCVIPAVDKMLLAFEEKDNPYANLLLAVGMYLKQRFVASLTGEPS